VLITISAASSRNKTINPHNKSLAVARVHDNHAKVFEEKSMSTAPPDDPQYLEHTTSGTPAISVVDKERDTK
jgi:hypothetical protein